MESLEDDVESPVLFLAIDSLGFDNNLQNKMLFAWCFWFAKSELFFNIIKDVTRVKLLTRFCFYLDNKIALIYLKT